MESPEAVFAWLEENVRVYEPTSTVELAKFAWSPRDSYGGTFAVRFDDGAASERYDFYADGAGHIQIRPPLYTSPLGAPATYGAVEISGSASAALLKGIRSLVPRLKPYGLERATGQHIDARTPLSDRFLTPLEDVKATVLARGLAAIVDLRSGDVRSVIRADEG